MSEELRNLPPAGAGGTERREPERSGGDRSGVTPAPAGSPNGPAVPTAAPEASSVEAGDAVSNEPPLRVEQSHLEQEALEQEVEEAFPSEALPALAGRGRARGRRLVHKDAAKPIVVSAEQRLLILDTWERSGLPAGDFAPLVGMNKHTLYSWKKKFDAEGPAGLVDKPRGGPRGSRLADLTKRTILMLKKANPEWGCQRLSDMLVRGPALPASPSAVAKVLHEAGYELEEVPTRPHPDKVRHFERATPNQLWQTDLFTFILKRQNRRVHLVAFMDDHSRFIVSYGLHASPSSALVLEVLRAALTSYGTPQEILNDNGTQYVTWRGKTVFTKELEKRGIKQVVAAPRRPQTLGKIERFWGTLWRECVESAVFVDLADAQRRIGLFIDHYNFQRAHQGIEGLVPADRFFGAAAEVRRTLAARVAANALELARNGLPKKPVYLTGQVDGQPFSVHGEGDRVVLRQGAGQRQEIELAPAPVPSLAGAIPELPPPLCPLGEVTGLGTESANAEPPAPGTSPLDEGLRRLRSGLSSDLSSDLDADEGGRP